MQHFCGRPLQPNTRYAHFDPLERQGVTTRSWLYNCRRSLFAVALSPAAVLAQSSSDINPAALQRLLAAAQATHSDAVVIWKDGRLVGSWHFGKPNVPIEAMSATKSIASLAVGRRAPEGIGRTVLGALWQRQDGDAYGSGTRRVRSRALVPGA